MHEVKASLTICSTHCARGIDFYFSVWYNLQSTLLNSGKNVEVTNESKNFIQDKDIILSFFVENGWTGPSSCSVLSSKNPFMRTDEQCKRAG